MTAPGTAALSIEVFGPEPKAEVGSPQLVTEEDGQTNQLIRAALGGDDTAMETLVRRIDPIVRARVGRALLKRRAEARGRNLRAEAEDFSQEVFVALFARRGKALRQWDPRRGLSFERFVGFLAEREVNAVLRTQRRSPWSEDPTEREALTRLRGGGAHREDDRVAARKLLEDVAMLLRSRLTPLGFHYFQRLFVDQAPIAELATETGVSKMSLYAWRTRLKRELERARQEIERGPK